ncbi:hypothetical protein P153DRAFT_369330 [Dothidotthia symphoricarpi CBS 119687]|uniref:C2H2-type domain-containing protein n=1 Tax=Dothidotthia symphoricarpi CBS 119687 TaxID=1392245 RepID=A0A6A6A443_9PLEO|nr:uncharacterized protein P153DRAFT_369330 [Dothidotthia symphoricarpi CBS 119687]KAF2126659.1 hypothetical protein P153DRAFT_369330 [Dothidotthia symphoricarpi CBS 119687]
MAIQQFEATNVSLTFKVIQFVKQLRRRVKLRIHCGSVCSSQLGTKSTGLRALTKITTGICQLSILDAKQSRRVNNRVSKRRKNSSELLRPQLRLSVNIASSNASGGEVQHVLSAVDDKLSPAGSPLSAIAGNDGLFLKQSSLSIFEGRPLNEAVQLLAAIDYAIRLLSECRSQYGDAWLVAQGHHLGLSIDECFIANYEHLLLRLEAELIDVIARKALVELLRGGRNEKQRKLLSWFTEFAEKPRPLSTSFPWTIKSSLAVLWGVCWMFYGYSSDEDTRGGNDSVPLDRLLQQIDFDLNLPAPAPSDYREFGLGLIETHSDSPVDREFQARTEAWQPDYNPLPQFIDQSLPLQPIYSDLGPFLPLCEPLALAPVNSGLSLDQSWQPHLPQRTNPHHHLTNTTPSITVTEFTGDGSFAAPHTGFASFGDSIYQVGHLNFMSPPNDNITFTFPHPQHTMVNTLGPDINAMQAPQPIHTHERKLSLNSNPDIPTPDSLDNRTPLPSPRLERDPMDVDLQNIARDDSEESSLPDCDDTESQQKNRSYKRAEEPPKNHDGKMICIHQDCATLMFDRKCEWSKHMDKHDRPYKCNVKGCEKLQGFTYSGGLLRHEREVHKMHGGTKSSLFCPFTDCKRSSGAGFTRKENLAEHIRRVHRRTSTSADLHSLVIPRRPSHESSPLVETPQRSESQYTPMVQYRDEDELSHKRKRGSISGYSDRGDDDMRAEIKRLRYKIEEKDARLGELERALMALQRR